MQRSVADLNGARSSVFACLLVCMIALGTAASGPQPAVALARGSGQVDFASLEQPLEVLEGHLGPEGSPEPGSEQRSGFGERSGVAFEEAGVTANWYAPPEELKAGATKEGLAAPEARASRLTAAQVGADRVSRMAYAGLNPAGAVALAERDFGVGRPGWTTPGSAAGTRISHYLSDYAATEEHADGKSVLVESSVPLRVRNRAGRLAPVSLALRSQNDAFAPENPIVPVSISRAVRNGVALPDGITVAAVGAAGSTPTVVGDTVVWPGEAADTDLLAEPTPLGVEISWQLRSGRSPQNVSLVFHLASGESLRMSASVPGGVEIVGDGRRLALVQPASARQSDGDPLAVTYTLDGDVLTAHVDLDGNVAFPVLLDPKIVVGHYGEEGKGWQNREARGSWHDYENCTGCFGFGAFRGTGEGLWRTVEPPYENTWANWYINPDNEQEVKITRVDVTGLTNTRSANTLEAGIYEQPGNNMNENGHGVYAYNDGGPAGTTPFLYSGENGGEREGKTMTFCAVGTGGSGSELCDENDGGEGFVFGMYKHTAFGTNTGTVGLETAQVRFIQSSYPTAKLEGVAKRWFNSEREGLVKVTGEDKSTGVAEVAVDAVPGTQSELEHGAQETPKPWESHHVPGTNPYTPECPNAFCYEQVWATFSLAGLGTGIWDVGGWSRNAVGYEHEELRIALIDNTPPEIKTPSWAGATLNDESHELSFSAVDGSPSAPQSSTDGMWLEIDGRDVQNVQTTCPKPEGIPEARCYELSGSYTLDGEDFAAGAHTVTLHAIDWAGNESERTFHVTIIHPAGQTQQVGPGTLNLQTGDYRLSATDASFSAGGGADLSVSRTYDSQSSESGPLGPGWTLSTPDTSAAGQWQSLEALSTGDVEATTTTGRKVLFTADAGGYMSPTGYQTYTLAKLSSSPAVYEITDAAGDYTMFEQPSGASAFAPTKVGQAAGGGGLNSVTYVLQEGRTEEIVGPEPTGVSCREKPLETRGCRVLTLNYATSTTAHGESSSEWGEYAGHLSSIAFTAWSPSEEKMTTTTVAEYEYDEQGRLRGEWDPHIKPDPLKTVYGYGSEGHLTALTPPGQQPYLFAYGTSAGGMGDAWLLSISRPGAATAFGNGSAPHESARPKLSSTGPTVGTTLKVSNVGTWTNKALAYVYQWEDCSASGGECAPIAGATNRSYTPQEGDIGHTLVAQVSAENGFGSEQAVTVASAVVPAGASKNNPVPEPPNPGTTAVTTIEYRVPVSGTGAPYAMGSKEVAAWAQEDPPTQATTIFPPDEPQGWPAGEYTRAAIYYFDSYDRRVNVIVPGGATTTTQYDSYDNVRWSLTRAKRPRRRRKSSPPKASMSGKAASSNARSVPSTKSSSRTDSSSKPARSPTITTTKKLHTTTPSRTGPTGW
jgi:hypothetical protein